VGALIPPLDDCSRSGQAPPRERRPYITPTLIWNDGQIELGHAGEFDVIVFDLSNRVRAAEIPLLAADFPERPPTIRRPGQGELLRPHEVRFDEEQPDAPQPFRRIEDQPDGLLSRLCGSPTGFCSGHQRRLDGMRSILRSDFDLGQALQVQPVSVGKRRIFGNWSDYAFTQWSLPQCGSGMKTRVNVAIRGQTTPTRMGHAAATPTSADSHAFS